MATFFFLLLLFCSLHYLFGANPELLGETFVSGDTEAVYQLPAVRRPNGVVFLAHGCHHSATDWWPHSPTCPNCIGLPMEMKIVSDGLRQGFVMLAVTSSNRQHKCWGQSDIPLVAALIQQFYTVKLKGNFSIPLHMLGASSGGGFVGFLAQSHHLKPKASSLCVQISTMRVVKRSYAPPVLFILMERDENMKKHVGEVSLNKKQVIVAHPVPINQTFFSQYIPGRISTSLSEKIVEALKEKGFIDPNTGLLLEDPRASDWRAALSGQVVHLEVDSLVADQSAISELMNVAWAYHEITALYNEKIFAFFHQNRQAVVF
eukprot:gene2506-2744_t